MIDRVLGTTAAAAFALLLSTSVPGGYGGGGSRIVPQPAPQQRPASAYEAAPMPDRDLSAPTSTVASNQPDVSPELFNTRNQYRGDGFDGNSTAQPVQEKNYRPTPGISLKVPLQ